MLALFAVCCLFLNDIIDSRPVSLSLTHFNSTRYPLAVCNDGSKGGFYWKKSPSSSPYWLVHLEGGGWCWDNASCEQRKISNNAYTTNVWWTSTVSKTGYFDDNSTLNPLYDANKIFVPYCTSDGWMGYKLPSSSNNNWYFMGQEFVSAVINTLIIDPLYGMGSSPNKDILVFAGCSAGGRGAMVNLDYLPQIIEPSGIQLKSLFGILDSGLYINIQPLSPYSSSTSLGNQTMDVYKYQNCTGRVEGSKCGNYYSQENEKWKCLFGQYKMPLLEIEHVINAAQYDSYQLGVDEGWNNPSKFTSEQKQYAENPFRSTIREVILNNITSDILSTACYHHCTSIEMEFWNVTTNGTSFSDMLRNYINGDNKNNNNNNKWIGNCTNGINCGQGCNPINQPWDHYHKL